MKPAICIEMLFQQDSFEERIKKIARAGFEYIEFWGWRDKNLSAIKEACSQNGVKVSNFSAHRVGDLVDPSTHATLLADYEDALKAAEMLGVKTLMVLTNELGDQGVVMNSFDNLSMAKKHAAVCAGLKKMLAMTPDDMMLVVESLNTVKDHVGYFLSDMDSASAVIEEIGDPRLKILCDLYHQGMMGDDLELDITRYAEHIGYYHIADFPGRHEPGTGKGDWKGLLALIKKTGYEGYAGFEYEPKGDSAQSLAVIADVWKSVI